jgi:zinc transport system permease protein
MIDLIAFPFAQRAILVGLIIGILGGFYGSILVQRRMSFLGSGLAHAAFGGVALGILLNMQPIFIALPFTVMVSLIITWLKEKTGLASDTSIGILFAVSVALGIVFLSLKETYTQDAYAFLFGSILSVSREDVIASIAMTAVTLLAYFFYWKHWAYATFDAELAKSDGIKVKAHNYILSVLISVTIVVAIKLVGIILVAAYLVIPAASARLISRRFFVMTMFSVALGILSSFTGLWASFEYDLPSGATIVLAQASFFVVLFVFSKVRG